MSVENEASVQFGQKTPAKIAKAQSKPMEEVKLDLKIDPRVSVEGISREMVQENMNAGGVMTIQFDCSSSELGLYLLIEVAEHT